MKIAVAQLNPTIGDLTGNAQQILAAAEQAAGQGVRLLLTPELSLCGYPPRDLLLDPSFIEAMATTLQQLSVNLPPELAVVVGCVEPNQQSLAFGGKPLFNSSALLELGGVQQIFYKRLSGCPEIGHAAKPGVSPRPSRSWLSSGNTETPLSDAKL